MFDPIKDRNGVPKRGKQFEQVSVENVHHNDFNLSYNSRGSYNMMWLYPVDFQKMEPGDTYNVKRSAIIKAAPMVAPIYQKIDVYFYTFKIPLRLLAHNYQAMRSPGNGTVSLSEALSYDAPEVATWDFAQLYGFLDFDDPTSEDSNLTLSTLSTHSRFRLLDELNMPSPVTYAKGTGSVSGTVVPTLLENDLAALSQDHEKWSVLPLRAYYKVWYDFFRDQNNYSIPEPLDSDTVTNAELARICQLRPKAWEHDYFTSALLTPQRGPAVNIELFDGDQGVNIDFSGITIPGQSYGRLLGVNMWNPTSPTTSSKLSVVGGIQSDTFKSLNTSTSGTTLTGTTTSLTGVNVPSAAMTAVTQGTIENATFEGQGVITINQLRTYSKMQEWLEIQARCGSRYNEFLLSNFGLVSSDARLQRPEFVAGGMMPLTISDVVNQSSNDTGSYSGIAEGQSGDLDSFSTYAEEDCYLMTLMTIMPHSSYSQGIRRYWTQKSTFDFYLPKFAQLGEEPVLNEELYYQFGNHESENKGTFGYQSRYQWMRYNPDTIHGDFRTTYNHWTLSRLFYSLPQLGYNFISGENVDARNSQLYRFFQVTDPNVDHFYMDIWHDIIAKRPLPEYNIPSLS